MPDYGPPKGPYSVHPAAPLSALMKRARAGAGRSKADLGLYGGIPYFDNLAGTAAGRGIGSIFKGFPLDRLITL